MNGRLAKLGTMLHSRLRLLVSDSSPLGCILLADALRTADDGIEVVARSTGVRAVLASVAQDTPDVALISAALEDGPLSGMRVLRELYSRFQQTRYLVLLDSAERELIVDAFYNGARGVCFRTDSLEMLPKAIRSVHAGQVWANSTHLQYVLEALAATAPLRIVNQRGEELLTQRQQQIVALVSQGFTNREIAERLFLSEHTVKNYLFRIFDKLGVSTRAELVLYALHRKEKAAVSDEESAA